MARPSRFLEVTALDPGGVTVQESKGVVKPLEAVLGLVKIDPCSAV